MRLSMKRLIAYWLDFMLLAVILISVQWLVYTVTSGFPFDFLVEGSDIELWVLATMSLPVWAYFIYFEMKKRQTMGKRWLRLVVGDEKGAKINFCQALCRTFIRLLPWELTHVIVLVPEPWWSVDEPGHPYFIYIPNIMMILYVVVLFSSKGKRTIHDGLTKTKVTERFGETN
ncbi:RDD family protein [Cohnella sp. JJ-181]|uniref:RDD family protein n=1 Tax=Cohnella rhizoplanae TaxID=2974897 RepID=UPI0022FF559F|nr:RDD family protein [Cohnella sp. JJ-181]CAI6023953.1 hypothetical protein COHCIP112018_00429 [Cohnella sp. JJ-181]